MTDRTDSPHRLEAAIAELADAVHRVEDRVAALERASGSHPVALPLAPEAALPAPPRREKAPGVSATTIEGQATPAATAAMPGAVSWTGRAFLILGGAFLIRAVTDAGTFPLALGLSAGLLYSLVWLLLADRAGRRGDSSGSTVLLIASSLIAYPLLVESVMRFKTSTNVAALCLGTVTVLSIAVTWRASLEVMAWIVTAVALGTGFVLMVATSAPETFTLVFLAFGAGSLWLTYGRRWHGLRWPHALAANAAVLLMTILAAWPGGPPETYRNLSPRRAILLALGLVAVYLGSFGARILTKHRSVNPFEITQTILALLVGFGGAVRVAHASPNAFPITALGLCALLAAVACYALAFAFVERRAESGPNFHFFTTLGLILIFAGGLVMVQGELLGLSWGFLGLVSAFLGMRFDRLVLRHHSAIYLAAAAGPAGVYAASADALWSQPRGLWGPVTGALLVIWVFGLLALALLGPPRRLTLRTRLPRLVTALVTALATLALAVAAIVAAIGVFHEAPIAPEALAAARTGVLCAAAAALAALRKRPALADLSVLAPPVLVATGLKLLVEDLPNGKPATLFLAFAFYGVALIAVPKLLRRAAAEGESR